MQIMDASNIGYSVKSILTWILNFFYSFIEIGCVKLLINSNRNFHSCSEAHNFKVNNALVAVFSRISQSIIDKSPTESEPRRNCSKENNLKRIFLYFAKIFSIWSKIYGHFQWLFEQLLNFCLKKCRPHMFRYPPLLLISHFEWSFEVRSNKKGKLWGHLYQVITNRILP